MSKIKYWPRRELLLGWLPAILYMALIFYMSSHPAPEEVKWLPIIAKLKLVHMIEYGILYLLLFWAIRKTTPYNMLGSFALALELTVIYGLTDEFHQIFVQGRTASLVDAFANGVGACLFHAGLSLRRKQSSFSEISPII